MRWLVLAMLVGCAEPTGMGAASTSAFTSAASATVTVANVFIQGNVGGETVRIWSVEIGEKPPGTDCKNRGDALVVFDVYTRLSSAPRGVVPLIIDPPPMLYPAVFTLLPDGFAIDGEMIIDAASTSGLFGSFHGTINQQGTVMDLDAEFAAPTCGV